ncbi:hypothetical protein, partial [Curtobacterium sp. B8]|uniref:hypothetical protein n=1 Tax=Curtobacterium sp. B8 TaxID=95611 RepID=UPI0004CFCF3E
MTRVVPAAEFPYVLERVGLVMEPLADGPLEAEGVLHPGERTRPGRGASTSSHGSWPTARLADR